VNLFLFDQFCGDSALQHKAQWQQRLRGNLTAPLADLKGDLLQGSRVMDAFFQLLRKSYV